MAANDRSHDCQDCFNSGVEYGKYLVRDEIGALREALQAAKAENQRTYQNLGKAYLAENRALREALTALLAAADAWLANECEPFGAHLDAAFAAACEVVGDE